MRRRGPLVHLLRGDFVQLNDLDAPFAKPRLRPRMGSQPAEREAATKTICCQQNPRLKVFALPSLGLSSQPIPGEEGRQTIRLGRGKARHAP